MMHLCLSRAGCCSITLAPQVAVACHGLAAFARYAVSNADAATRCSLPSHVRSAATLVSHGLIGVPLGLCAWSVLEATAGDRLYTIDTSRTCLLITAAATAATAPTATATISTTAVLLLLLLLVLLLLLLLLLLL